MVALEFDQDFPGEQIAVTLLGDTPVGRKTLGQFGFVVADNATNFVIFTSSDEVDEVPAVTNCDLATPSTSDGDTAHMDIVTDTSSQIRGRQSTGALDTFEMYTRGWVDFELDD